MLRYTANGEVKYLAEATELTRPERNTLTVSFEDVEKYNQQLATTVLQEYYRYVVCIWLNNGFQIDSLVLLYRFIFVKHKY